RTVPPFRRNPAACSRNVPSTRHTRRRTPTNSNTWISSPGRAKSQRCPNVRADTPTGFPLLLDRGEGQGEESNQTSLGFPLLLDRGEGQGEESIRNVPVFVGVHARLHSIRHPSPLC